MAKSADEVEVPTPTQSVPAPDLSSSSADPPIPQPSVPQIEIPDVAADELEVDEESSMELPDANTEITATNPGPGVITAAPFSIPAQPVETKVGLPPDASVTVKTNMQGMKDLLAAKAPAVKPDYSGIAPIHHNAAKLIEQWAAMPHDGFRLVVVRRRPAVWNGYKMTLGSCIEDLEPMLIADLREAITQLHGGGEYMVRAVTPQGTIAHQLPIRIDENQHAPKPPPNAQQIPGAANQMTNSQFTQMTGAPVHGRVGFDQELHEIQQRELMVKAEARAEKAMADLSKTRRMIQKEEQREREREEQAAMQSTVETDRRIESLRDDMKEMMRGFQEQLKTVVEIATKKDDSTLPIMVESMKAMTESANRSAENNMKMFTAMLAANGNKGASPELLEAIKMSGEASKSSAMAIADASKQEAATMRDLFMAMVTKQLSGPDDKVKTYVDAQDKGWERAMQIMQLVNPGETEDSIDPESGFWSNAGNLLLRGAQRFVEGAAKAGPGILNAMRPSSQFEAYEPPAAALPAPAPVASTPSPATAPVPVAAMPAPASASGATGNPFIEGIIEDPEGPPAPVQTAPAQTQQVQQPGPQTDNPAMEDDLRGHVTEAMRFALDDFNVGRKVHDWAEYATDKWHYGFKTKLAHAVDDADRIELIRQKCDPAVWAQIDARLKVGAQDVMYFMNALHMLVSDVVKPVAA